MNRATIASSSFPTAMHHHSRLHHRFELGLPSPDRCRKSLLTEGIFTSNIDVSQPDCVRVALWREWRTMLGGLPDIGPVWRMTRNGHAVLVMQDLYPHLTFSANEQGAEASQGDTLMSCHFRAWRKATAFDSGCACGRIYGFEVENAEGDVFHRVCLAKGTGVTPFLEWTQVHQATGLELDDESPQAAIPRVPTATPGTLDLSPHLLRVILIMAAQREIPIVAAVTAEGMTQSARIEIEQAVENQGWLVLSGSRRSLYVESESRAWLQAAPKTLEGESVWTLSLLRPDGGRLLFLHGDPDHREAWNRLIREMMI